MQRAVALGASLGKKKTAFHDAVRAVETAIDAADEAQAPWIERLMELLLRYNAGEPAKYAALSQQLALDARKRYETEGVGNGLWCQRERDYLSLEAEWARRGRDRELSGEAQLELVDAFVRQADGVISASWPAKYNVAAHFVSQAIGQLQRIGGHAEKRAALQHRLEHLQRASVAELPTIELPTSKLEEVRSDVRVRFSGKPLHEALVMLALIHVSVGRMDTGASVEARAGNGLAMTFSSTVLGPRGTTQSTRGPVDGLPDDFAVEVDRRASEVQRWVAVALLMPAVEQLMADHNLTTRFFVELAARSGFVGNSRALSFGKGLAAGARGDFDVAAALLFPQFEHGVRELFFAHNIVTTTSPTGSSQNEHDLNKLLAHEALGKLFGDDAAYDMRVLLIEKSGANLRNHLAHGILDDGQDLEAKVYFWWLCLRMVCLPLVRAVLAEKATSQET